MTEEIFENYEAFYCMLTSVTMLSNTHSNQLIADGEKVIEFIGNAYFLSNRLVEECKKVILEELCEVALITDAKALYNTVDPEGVTDKKQVLFEAKGNVLEEIYNLGYSAYSKMHHFDYTHYTLYEPHIRFRTIQEESVKGNIIATRQAGIMKMLGIGCKQNSEEATARLFQCALWADIPSMYLLAHCHKIVGNEKSQIFYDLAEICSKFLKIGVTVLPQSAKEGVSDETCAYYTYISTILQDVILAYKAYDIDFSFVEAITSDKLDYFQRMNYINNYDKKEWKNVTNTAVKPTKKIGF